MKYYLVLNHMVWLLTCNMIKLQSEDTVDTSVDTVDTSPWDKMKLSLELKNKLLNFIFSVCI